MTIVEATVTLSINQNHTSLEELEAQIQEQVMNAGKDLLQKAMQAVEQPFLDNANFRKSKRRKHYLLTRFGWIHFYRWQLRSKEGSYSYPLDEVLGLEPRQHTSPWILQQCIALATRIPYRQAATLLSQFLDEDLDHRSLYRWVQKAGAKIVEEEDALQEEVFQHGVIPPRADQEHEIILSEVDGTFLKAQREEGSRFEVRLGFFATGKELESKTAKHRRYRLKDLVCYAGVETAQNFGERLFLKGEASLGLSRAQHLLMVGDGADWIEALAGHDRWKATYQLDWWHLIHAIRRTFAEFPALVHKLKQLLYDGEGEQMIPLVRMAQLQGTGDAEQVETLLQYLETNQKGFYGAQTLWDQVSDAGKQVCVQGSGAIEKHVDLRICRRFKGQGMRWTRAGANRLLKLRVAELALAA